MQGEGRGGREEVGPHLADLLPYHLSLHTDHCPKDNLDSLSKERLAIERKGKGE